MILNYATPLTALVLGLMLCSSATAQSLQVTCPSAEELKAEQLHGNWAVSFETPALASSTTLQLRRHAEFSESLAGSVSRQVRVAGARAPATTKAALAGDLEGGLLLLDESSNGINITGTWNGEMVKGSCGRLFKGWWKDTSATAPADAPELAFVLRRLP